MSSMMDMDDAAGLRSLVTSSKLSGSSSVEQLSAKLPASSAALGVLSVAAQGSSSSAADSAQALPASRVAPSAAGSWGETISGPVNGTSLVASSGGAARSEDMSVVLATALSPAAQAAVDQASPNDAAIAADLAAVDAKDDISRKVMIVAGVILVAWLILR